MKQIEGTLDIYLPSAFGKNPWCDEDAHHRDRADIGEEFPICHVVRDPRQNCASNSEVYAKSNINHESSPVHSHVLEHWRDSKFASLISK